MNLFKKKDSEYKEGGNNMNQICVLPFAYQHVSQRGGEGLKSICDNSVTQEGGTVV